jgi:hypothetical protein
MLAVVERGMRLPSEGNSWTAVGFFPAPEGRCIHGAMPKRVCDLAAGATIYGVPQPRRPGNRATPLEVTRFRVWHRSSEPQLTRNWDARARYRTGGCRAQNAAPLGVGPRGKILRQILDKTRKIVVLSWT